jgi:hypothetical protein
MDPRERFNKALKEFLKDKQFQSLEEAQAVVNEFTYRYNNTPLDDFCGLTPNEMHKMLYFPFFCPEVVRFNFKAAPPVKAPYVNLFLLLISGINEAGRLKTTAKGNLPRDFCRRLDEQYHSEEARRNLMRDKHPIMKETDFWDLHFVRLITERAGYIRKYKKHFVLTKKGQSIVAKGFTIQDYFRLFQIYTIQFNWAYTDSGEEILHLQNSFLFTLYLLKLYGSEYRPMSFYAKQFIKAFPAVLSEVLNTAYFTPEEKIEVLYNHRVLMRFAIAWGFAKTKKNDPHLSMHEKTIKKTAFLDEFVEFHVPAAEYKS